MEADVTGAGDAGFERIAHLLWRVGDTDIGPEEVRQLTDEMSRLLWDISESGFPADGTADMSDAEFNHGERYELPSPSHRVAR